MKNATLFRSIRTAAALLLALSLLCGSLTSSAQAQSGLALSNLFTFPANSYPTALANGPLGALWFTLGRANAVGQLDLLPPAWQPTALTTPGSMPFDIAVGPDAALWFTERLSGKIGRLDPAGGLSEFELDNPASYPSQIVSGQDDGLWFTEFFGNRIGRIALDGTIDEYVLPNADSRPLGIASDLDGNLWFTEWNGYRIGKIDPLGNISEYPIPGAIHHPTEIAVDGDGFLWFIYEIGQTVVRVDPTSGAMTSYLLAAGSTAFTDLAIGLDGRLWLLGTQTVARMTLPVGDPPVVETLGFTDWVFSGEGRSQIIAGPSMEMLFTNARTQDVKQVSLPDATGRDLQVFVHPYPDVMLISGEFEMNIEVANWSSLAATDVRIQFYLPETAHFLRAGSAGLSCGEDAGIPYCQIDSLAGNERVTIPFFFQFDRLAAEQTIEQFVVKVSSAALDPLPANNRAFRSLTFQRTIDYFNDFNTLVDERWSDINVTSPDGSLKYLGPFDNQSVTLTFPNLTHHDQVDLCFDLYILGAWDGSSLVDPADTSAEPPVIGPDLWANFIDESILRVTTYSNRKTLVQSYPAEYNEGTFPAQTRAAATGDFDGDGVNTDSRYRLCVVKPHTRAVLKYTFYGANLDSSSGERWALDNVSVRIYYRSVYDWLYMPLLVR